MPNNVYDDNQEPNTGTGDAAQNEINRLAGDNPSTRASLNRAAGNDRASNEELRRLSGHTPSNKEELRDSTGANSQDDIHSATGNTPEARNSLSQATSIPMGNLFRPDSEGGGGLKDKTKRLVSRLAKHKKRNIIIGSLSSVLLLAIFIIIFILSSLLIPNLARNISEYEFERLIRQYAKSQDAVVDESLAEGATPTTADDATAKALQREFEQTAKAGLLYRIFARPSLVKSAIKELQVNHGLQIVTKHNLFGREVIRGVTLDGVTYLPKKQGFTKYLPGLGDAIDFKNNVTFAKNFAPALRDALDAGQVGPLVRLNEVAKALFGDLGFDYTAWKIGAYQGKNATQARLIEEREKIGAVNKPGTPDDSLAEPDKEAVQDARTADASTVASDAKLQATINNGGVMPGVRDAINNALSFAGLKKVIGFLNIWYAIALYICTILDGALERSGGTINNQVAQEERAYTYIASAADQQTVGGGEIGPAVQATNNDLNPNGEIADSNPLLRAGGRQIDTTNTLSAEASAGGFYTLLYLTPGIPKPVADFIDSAVVAKFCPIITNLWVAGPIAAAQLIALFTAPGGRAAGQAVKVVVEDSSRNLIARIVTGSFIKGRVFKFIFTTTRDAAGLAAITFFAHMVVLTRAQQVDSGSSQGNDLANEADAGANLIAGQIERQCLYGRPLTKAEIAENDLIDKQSVSYQNSQQSAYQRYFALSNPDSLFSKMGITLYADVYDKQIFGTISSVMTKLFNPLKMASDIFGSLDSKSALAAAAGNDDSTDYGNVQFGYSQQEENLINSGRTYRPLENQRILDLTGKEDAITQLYGKCFTDDLGTILSKGWIIRDPHGNVIANQGLCSPDNLGLNNPQFCYNVTDPTTHDNYHGCDLVFRWRMALSYNCAIDQLQAEGNPS